MQRNTAIALSLLATGVAVGAAVVAAKNLARGLHEQPEYEVIGKRDGWELRRYEPTLQARVTVQRPYDEALREGFRILAAFIFGDNTSRDTIEMTAPVTAEPARGARGEDIDMTSPVQASPEGSGWSIRFVMPSEYTKRSLPVPDDPRIHIEQVPGRVVAARRFAGRAGEQRVEKELAALAHDLVEEGVDEVGEPTIAQYDPPVVPGFLRRNEVLVPLPSY